MGAGGSRAFTYDAAGNVTLDNRTGGGYSYTYDSAGRMASISINLAAATVAVALYAVIAAIVILRLAMFHPLPAFGIANLGLLPYTKM